MCDGSSAEGRTTSHRFWTPDSGVDTNGPAEDHRPVAAVSGGVARAPRHADHQRARNPHRVGARVPAVGPPARPGGKGPRSHPGPCSLLKATSHPGGGDNFQILARIQTRQGFKTKSNLRASRPGIPKLRICWGALQQMAGWEGSPQNSSTPSVNFYTWCGGW